jgi:hypothetical protein
MINNAKTAGFSNMANLLALFLERVERNELQEDEQRCGP